jgi:hypothetical protein
MDSVAPVHWPSTCHPSLAFDSRIGLPIMFIQSEVNFTQCQLSICIVRNDQHYVLFVCWCQSIQS